MRTLYSYLRRFRRDRCGSMAVEFAFIGPVMFAMLFGVIEFGRFAYTQSTLNFAAEETTRFAIVNGGNVTNDQLVNYARTKLLGLDDNLAVLCLLTPVTTVQTSTVSIAIDYDFDLLLPLPMDDIVLQGRSDGFISFSPVDPDTDLTGDCGTP